MSELTIRHLLKSGFEVVMVSRNIKKAKLLAQSFDREIDVQPYENINKLSVPFKTYYSREGVYHIMRNKIKQW